MWTNKELGFIESYREDIEAKLLTPLFIALNQHFDGSTKGDYNSRRKLKILFTYAFQGKEGFYIEIDRRGKSKSLQRANIGQERFRIYIRAKGVVKAEGMWIDWFKALLRPSALKGAMFNPLIKWGTNLTGNPSLSREIARYLIDNTDWEN